MKSLWLAALLCIGLCPEVGAQGVLESKSASGFGAGFGAGLGALGARKIMQQAVSKGGLKTTDQVKANATYNALKQQLESNKKNGNIEESLKGMKMLADFREKQYGPNDKEAFSLWMQAAELAQNEKRWSDAETFFRRAQSNCARRKGPGCEESIPILTGLSTCLVKQDKICDAAAQAKLALSLEQCSNKVSEEERQQRRLQVAELCIKAGDYAGAEPILKSCIETEQKNSPGSERLASMTTSYNNIRQQLSKNSPQPVAPSPPSEDEDAQ